MTRDLHLIGVAVMAPVVMYADDPIASGLWLVWFAYTAWLRWRFQEVA